MGIYARGDVVAALFPYSTQTGAKIRPAVVLALLPDDDMILCAVTSQAARNNYAIPLVVADFYKGGLNKPSLVRPEALFTCHVSKVGRIHGKLKPSTLNRIVAATKRIISK